ncbi:hypothetical protein [Streptomyces sp. NPDC045369]|uniref:hypothetical protein n=1 Tax=Streptomyces sp. NPDC045369 TaxID=3155732 RepID=UPI003403AB5B
MAGKPHLSIWVAEIDVERFDGHRFTYRAVGLGVHTLTDDQVREAAKRKVARIDPDVEMIHAIRIHRITV